MAYRNEIDTLEGWVADIDRRLRAVEQPGCCPPDPGWVLAQVGTNLQYLYVPTGAIGPVIGTQ